MAEFVSFSVDAQQPKFMSEERWIWQCEREIPSKTGEGRQLLQRVLDQLNRAKWPEHDIFSIHLAMEEALVNAIKHGNRFDPTKQVSIKCRLSSNLFQIEITDEGAGFDLSTLADPTEQGALDHPNGRGVLLMRSFMTRMEYNEQGNGVLLEKRRAFGDID